MNGDKTPDKVLHSIHQKLGKEGPVIEVLVDILQALKDWPQADVFKTELYYFLQEAPAQPLSSLPLDISHELKSELLRLLPQEQGNLSIIQAWVLSLLESQKSWQAFSALRSALVLPQSPPQIFAQELFQIMMTKTVLARTEWELSLRQLRSLLLAEQLYLPQNWESTLVLIAQQAWNNQYVWYISPVEEVLLQELWQQETYSPLQMAILASYLPLTHLKKQVGTEYLESLALRSSEWQALIKTSLQEPLREAEIKRSLPSLISSPPQDNPVVPFYERFPYPRWFGPPIIPPSPLQDRLAHLFPYHAWDKHFVKDMRVLIAGCGTGQELLHHYWQNPRADITGIDLSLSSLSYAQRQFEQHKVPAKLFQADLMNLAYQDPALKPFDWIESGGVIHHLSHPKQGLINLLTILKPGGILKLGLYSKSGRQSILHLKDSLGITKPLSLPEMRQLRQSILCNQNPHLDWLKRLSEFYQMNHCMDLLCHPQEQNYDLPELEQWFKELKLNLIGLMLWNPMAYRWYKQRFPDDPKATSLQNWWQCEQKNPQLFWPMYIFWLQKPEASTRHAT